MKKSYNLDINFISKLFGIEKLWIILFKNLPSFYQHAVNKRYRKMKESVINVKDVSIKLSVEDSYSRTWIYKKCAFNKIHEEKVLDFLVEDLKSSKCFVDIGAHLGYYTFIASELMPSGIVYSFEMDEINYKLLEKNTKLNKSKNVFIHNLAVSNSTGVLSYNRNSEQPDPTLCPTGNNAVLDKSVSVRAVSLDDFFKDKDPKPDVIKIDVEGAEMQVLNGMKQLLEQDNLKLYVEVHPERLPNFGLSVYDVISFLLDNSFNVFEIEDMRKKNTQKMKDVRNLRKLAGDAQLLKNTMLYAYK